MNADKRNALFPSAFICVHPRFISDSASLRLCGSVAFHFLKARRSAKDVCTPTPPRPPPSFRTDTTPPLPSP